MVVKMQPFRIKEIDEENRIIRFDPSKHGKITGSRFYSILGEDPYTSEFAAACNISRIYTDYEETKYTLAGEAIEPIIRNHVRDHAHDLLDGYLRTSSSDNVGVENPVAAKECGYDHFRFDPVFGGMVDGYIRVNGKRRAILEIKTASSREKWTDAHGNIACAPDNYVLQASLYAELSELDEIIFAVGFLNEDDYEHPEQWTPKDDNFYIVYKMKKDISEEMDSGRKWFQKYILGGVTPCWSDRDMDIINNLTIRKVDFVPGDLTELIREYAASNDPSVEPRIKEHLESLVTGSMKGLEYDQNGMTFRLIPRQDSKGFEMTIIRN